MSVKAKNILNYIKIVLLAILIGANYVIFIVKNNFAPAGIGGIATMIEYKTGFSIGFFTLIVNTK